MPSRKHTPSETAAADNIAASAEASLADAEAAYVKLHPLASQGNDVSPITRGELRLILEDLLMQMGKAAPGTGGAPGGGVGAADVQELQDGLQKLRNDMASMVGGLNQVLQRVIALENAMLPKDSGGHAPQLDMSGAEQFLALGWDRMVEYASTNGIDISVVTPRNEQMLAEFLAAAANLLHAG